MGEHLSGSKKRIYSLAGAVVVANAAGNSMLRVGLESVGSLVSFAPMQYLRAFLNVWVAAGIVLLIAWLILQLSLLSWADLTFVLPVTASAYIVITIVGAFLLGEEVSLAHWAGVCLILVGVIVVGRTKPLTSELAEGDDVD